MNRLGILMGLLSDGKWHRLEDVALELGVSVTKIRKVLGSLSSHGIVSYRYRDDSVRLDEELSVLFRET